MPIPADVRPLLLLQADENRNENNPDDRMVVAGRSIARQARAVRAGTTIAAPETFDLANPYSRQLVAIAPVGREVDEARGALDEITRMALTGRHAVSRVPRLAAAKEQRPVRGESVTDTRPGHLRAAEGRAALDMLVFMRSLSPKQRRQLQTVRPWVELVSVGEGRLRLGSRDRNPLHLRRFVHYEHGRSYVYKLHPLTRTAPRRRGIGSAAVDGRDIRQQYYDEIAQRDHERDAPRWRKIRAVIGASPSSDPLPLSDRKRIMARLHPDTSSQEPGLFHWYTSWLRRATHL